MVQEYLDLNHAEMVPSSQLNKPCEQTFYLPMHGVTKSSSTSTKLSVVFDASAHTSSNISLNQSLFVGPTLFPNLDQILLKFRMYPVALSADISKMYRAVEPEEVDRDLLWRADPKSPVTDYRMTQVTFGVTSSPFLAVKALQQTALDFGDDYPLAKHRNGIVPCRRLPSRGRDNRGCHHSPDRAPESTATRRI